MARSRSGYGQSRIGYGQGVQPLVVNPIGIDTFSAIPMARNYAKAAGIRAAESLEMEYNVDQKDLPYIKSMVEPIEANKEAMVDRIMKEGVSDNLISDFMNMKKGYQHAKNQVKFAEETKKDVDRWEQRLVSLHGKDAEYIDFIKNKEYRQKPDANGHGWGGTFSTDDKGNTMINKFDPTLGPMSFNIPDDLIATFKQAKETLDSETSGYGAFATRRVPATTVTDKDANGKNIIREIPARDRLVFVTQDGKEVYSNESNLVGLMEAKIAEYSNPKSPKGSYIDYRELSLDDIISTANNLKESFESERVAGGNKRYQVISEPRAGTGSSSTKLPTNEFQPTATMVSRETVEDPEVVNALYDSYGIATGNAKWQMAASKGGALFKNIGWTLAAIGGAAKGFPAITEEALLERDAAAVEAEERQKKIANRTQEEIEATIDNTYAFSQLFTKEVGLNSETLELAGEAPKPSQVALQQELSKVYRNTIGGDENPTYEQKIKYNDEAEDIIKEHYASIGTSTYNPEYVYFEDSPYNVGKKKSDILDGLDRDFEGLPSMNLDSKRQLNGGDEYKILQEALLYSATMGRGSNVTKERYSVKVIGNATGDERFYKNNEGQYVAGLEYGNIVQLFDGETPGAKYLIGAPSGTVNDPRIVANTPTIKAMASLKQMELKLGKFQWPKEWIVDEETGGAITEDVDIQKSIGETLAYKRGSNGEMIEVVAPANSILLYPKSSDLPILYTSELLTNITVGKDGIGTSKALVQMRTMARNNKTKLALELQSQ